MGNKAGERLRDTVSDIAEQWKTQKQETSWETQVGHIGRQWSNNREIMGNGETIEKQRETIWKTKGREVGDKRHKSGRQLRHNWETIRKQWRENRETIARQLGDKVQDSSGRRNGRYSGRQVGDSWERSGRQGETHWETDRVPRFQMGDKLGDKQAAETSLETSGRQGGKQSKTRFSKFQVGDTVADKVRRFLVGDKVGHTGRQDSKVPGTWNPAHTCQRKEERDTTPCF